MNVFRKAMVSGALGAMAFSGGVMSQSATADLELAIMESPCPEAGTMRVAWRGATPRNQVALIWARGNGGGLRVPQSHSCAGTEMGLGRNNAQAVYLGTSGRTGQGVIGRAIGPNACNGFLQMLDVGTCTVSEVIDVFVP